MNIADQLREIANQLDSEYVETTKTGAFEKITEDELNYLKKRNEDFDAWFEILTANFDLKTYYPDSDELHSIKNLVRHGWYAKSKIQDSKDSE